MVIASATRTSPSARRGLGSRTPQIDYREPYLASAQVRPCVHYPVGTTADVNARASDQARILGRYAADDPPHGLATRLRSVRATGRPCRFGAASIWDAVHPDRNAERGGGRCTNSVAVAHAVVFRKSCHQQLHGWRTTHSPAGPAW